MQCPHCDQEHSEGVKFCPVTGKGIEIPNVCPQCGKSVDANWRHCGHCGGKLIFVGGKPDHQESLLPLPTPISTPAQIPKKAFDEEPTNTQTGDEFAKTTAAPPGKLVGGNQELNDYILNADGLSRKALNIMCLIGVFIFGWLLKMAFESLGKKYHGWFYIVPILVCIGLSRFSDSYIGLLAPIIYIVGWVHANMVLSRYQSSARRRIAQINRLPESKRRIDEMLEKGLLQSKVLSDHEAATATFVDALKMTGGSARLLKLAGSRLLANKQSNEAKQFFARAESSALEGPLTK